MTEIKEKFIAISVSCGYESNWRGFSRDARSYLQEKETSGALVRIGGTSQREYYMTYNTPAGLAAIRDIAQYTVFDVRRAIEPVIEAHDSAHFGNSMWLAIQGKRVSFFDILPNGPLSPPASPLAGSSSSVVDRSPWKPRGLFSDSSGISFGPGLRKPSCGSGHADSGPGIQSRPVVKRVSMTVSASPREPGSSSARPGGTRLRNVIAPSFASQK